MFSLDHPAFSFENLSCSCLLIVFVSYFTNTSALSATGVLHFRQGMDQKLAATTFPTNGLVQNMVFKLREETEETTRNTKELGNISPS